MGSQIKFRDQVEEEELTRFGRSRQWGRKRLLICQPGRIGPRVKTSQVLYLVLLLTICVNLEDLFNSDSGTYLRVFPTQISIANRHELQ